jgi:phage terminase large subunit-like protein
LKEVDDVPEGWKWGKQARYWDMAGTEKKKKNGKSNDPDELVGSRVLIEDGVKEPGYCIMDQVGGYWEWDKLLETIEDTAIKDGPEVTVVIEQEPGSGGKNQCAAIEARFKDSPRYPQLKYWKVERQLPTDRVQEAYVWFGYANSGKVYYVKNAFWNKPLLEQVDGFTFMLHDDRVTSVSGAIRWLSPIWKVWKITDEIYS